MLVPRTALRPPLRLVLGLAALGAMLSIAAVPGVFLVDDNNYLVNVLALREGHVTVANSAGLSPSRELLFFDPTATSRAVTATPVASTAPPLYAPLALPFAWLGWRGLVALNTLSYLVTIVLVLQYAQRYSAAPATGWLAAGAFAFGGYALEYALGLWPQALSFALCTAGIVAAGRVLDDGPAFMAGAAGLLLGLAAGVRYQNAVILAVVGAALGLWSVRRVRMLAAFVAAATIPLVASATINHLRFDSWNPISKGPGYLSTPLGDSARTTLLDPAVMLWAHVVDYSARPPLTAPDVQAWLRYDPTTGAHLLLGIASKKALLQSAPWAVLALALFVAAWVPRFRMASGQRRQLRLLSVVALSVLATFSVAGVNRHDGLSFNGRYLLELLPIAAVAFAWAFDQRTLARRPLYAGAVCGVVGVLLILFATPLEGGPEIPLWLFRQFALLKLPLLLAAGLAVLWLVERRGGATSRLLDGAVGACLAWGLMLHVGSDVAMAQSMRMDNRARTDALRAVLTDGSALVAYWGHKDAIGPLLFDRDIVVLDAHVDEGQDAPTLIRELLTRGRRVYVLDDAFPPDVLSRVTAGLSTVPLRSGTLRLREVRGAN